MTAPHDPESLVAGRLGPDGHCLPVRIYYEDTDAGGIVYHAAYVRFMERGRTDFLRHLGVRQSEASAGPEGVFFAVRHMEIDFLKPARLDDLVEVRTALREIGGARLVLAQSVRIGAEILVSAKVTIAALGKTGRPRRIPEAVRAAFARFASV
ncbi:tol-pal system-associated acyl-CoA thioesterase [Prosthecomicrobium sp. N25]|uniref:tol-pal system-associated acyl-CoA thioesterase n=1 Tax=Prosthecomicrobium sp. N25 TaxID=3129254 RepID=UPI0030785F91